MFIDIFHLLRRQAAVTVFCGLAAFVAGEAQAVTVASIKSPREVSVTNNDTKYAMEVAWHAFGCFGINNTWDIVCHQTSVSKSGTVTYKFPSLTTDHKVSANLSDDNLYSAADVRELIAEGLLRTEYIDVMPTTVPLKLSVIAGLFYALLDNGSNSFDITIPSDSGLVLIPAGSGKMVLQGAAALCPKWPGGCLGRAVIPAAVPLPATGALMLVGVFAFGLLRRL